MSGGGGTGGLVSGANGTLNRVADQMTTMAPQEPFSGYGSLNPQGAQGGVGTPQITKPNYNPNYDPYDDDNGNTKNYQPWGTNYTSEFIAGSPEMQRPGGFQYGSYGQQPQMPQQAQMPQGAGKGGGGGLPMQAQAPMMNPLASQSIQQAQQMRPMMSDMSGLGGQKAAAEALMANPQDAQMIGRLSQNW